MRTFLGFLMVLIVSGDEEITVNCVSKDSVLLPCSCPDTEEFKWQMDRPNKALVFKKSPSEQGEFSDKYKNRAKIFLNENNPNCSILLINITTDDQGRYRCAFQRDEQYTIVYVNLNISENKPHGSPGTSGSLSSKSACSLEHLKMMPVLVTLGFSLIG